MRRLLAAVLLVGCGGAPAPTAEPSRDVTPDAAPPPGSAPPAADEPQSPLVFRSGPGGFPVPAEADEMPGSGTSTMFPVHRPTTFVYDQLRAQLALEGFAIVDDAFYSGGHRLTVTRGPARYFASVTDVYNGVTLLSLTVEVPPP